MNIKKIMQFNQDQLEHERIFQALILGLVNKLLVESFDHDHTKWSEKEYESFVNARDALRGSKTGQDDVYKEHLNSEAIQHHITENPHHPEYWDNLGKPMPVYYCISMFFDWHARCLQKGGSMDDFWEFNLSKLDNQPHAKVIAEALKKEYCEEK